MTPQELHFRRVASFRDLATEELKAARLLAPSLRGQAAYFLQQCVEKLARGLLETEMVQVGPTHEIGRLAALLPASNVFVQDLKKLDELSPAATRFRYPGGSGNVRTISADDVNRLLAAVEKFYADVEPVLAAYMKKERL